MILLLIPIRLQCKLPDSKVHSLFIFYPQNLEQLMFKYEWEIKRR